MYLVGVLVYFFSMDVVNFFVCVMVVVLINIGDFYCCLNLIYVYRCGFVCSYSVGLEWVV